MKVKVIEKAFYNLEYLKEGQIIDFKGKKLPSWATLADGIETQKGKSNKNNKEQSVPEVSHAPENTPEILIQETISTETNENTDITKVAESSNENEQLAPENRTQSDKEKQEYLDLLINEGIEKGVFVEDADKKSVDEQISELEAALNK